MKFVLLIAVAALALAFGSTEAQSAVHWPAKCSSWSCVNSHLNNLNKRTKAVKASLRVTDSYVFGCLAYGFPPIGKFGGYAAWPDPAVEETALDYSTVPDFYALAVNPDCVVLPARQTTKAGDHSSFHLLALKVR